MGITSVRLKPEIENPLEIMSKELDRSKSYLINKALKEFLDRSMVEGERWKETIKAIESVKSGKVVNETDVDKWLDSWGSDNELEPPKA